MAGTATAPWSPQASTATVDAYGLLLNVSASVAGYATQYPLSVVSGRVDFDAARSPRVHADITVAWPSDSVRALLDPRLGLEVSIDAGYKFLGTGTEDVQTLATLRVQEVTADHAEKSIQITADSDEIVPIGYPIETAVTYTTTNEVLASIKAVVEAAFPGETLAWSIGENVRSSETFVDTQELTPGQDRWGFVADWADSIGAVVYHDGLGVWHVDQASPVPSAYTVANLTTGERGTIVNVRTIESRNAYANRAAAVYEYTVGSSSYRVTAIAKTDLTPRTMVTQVNRFKPHNATEVARQMLLRGLRRGHTVEVDAASWLWIRPGYTVTTTLDDGTHERLLVETVSFDLGAGSMNLRGQNADDAPLAAITTTTTTTTL